MAMLIQIPGDKRTFVAGMYWRHEDRYPNRKAMLEGARDRDYWTTIRRTRSRSIQSGFCEPVDIGKPGVLLKKTVYSLAGAVAEVMEEPWLGIFDLGDGLYWYIAVRDNYEVLPDGDIIGDMDTVNRARQAHASYGDWRKLTDDNIDGLAKILKQSRNAPRINDLRRKTWVPWVAYGGTAVLVAGASMGGWMFYHQHEAHIAEEKRLAVMRQLAVVRAMDAKKAAANVPWRTTALPSDFISACMNAVSAMPFSDQGWVLQGVTCHLERGGKWMASADWQRGLGSTALWRPKGLLMEKGNLVTDAVVGMGHLSVPQQSGLWVEHLAEERLYGVTQLLQISVRLEAQSHVPTQALPGANAVQHIHRRAKPWKGLGVMMTVPLSEVGTASKIMDTVPGLRIQQVYVPVIEKSGKKGGEKLNMNTVKMTGDLYVKQ